VTAQSGNVPAHPGRAVSTEPGSGDPGDDPLERRAILPGWVLQRSRGPETPVTIYADLTDAIVVQLQRSRGPETPVTGAPARSHRPASRFNGAGVRRPR